MESKHLNDEQINFLKDYIRKRGFVMLLRFKKYWIISLVK